MGKKIQAPQTALLQKARKLDVINAESVRQTYKPEELKLFKSTQWSGISLNEDDNKLIREILALVSTVVSIRSKRKQTKKRIAKKKNQKQLSKTNRHTTANCPGPSYPREDETHIKNNPEFAEAS